MSIDLSNWKLTLPVGTPGRPTEVKQPALATYASDWFRRVGDAFVFVAPTDGVTTKNSKNPRSELREMSGTDLAAWSSTIGRHSMEVELSVDALPIGPKPHVVVAQIHDGNDDVCVFRVEGGTIDRERFTIWITDGDNTHACLLTTDYRLGDRIQVGFDVADGVIRYYHQNQLIDYRQEKKVKDCFFKAGCYNNSGGIVTKLPDGRPDFAQVTLYACTVTHEAATDPVVTPDATARQIAELQRQMAALTAAVQRHEQRWAALGKAVTL